MPKKHSRTGITSAVLLDHMRGMEGRLHTEIKEVRLDLRSTEARLIDRIDRVERNLTVQIEGLDHRLDDIEVSQIPKLKKAVGIR